MAFSIPDTVTLNNGLKMPIIGLGTWQSKEDDMVRAINAALEMGYRHIDTAFAYRNEDVIGKVLKEWFTSGKLQREDLFVTTKLTAIGMRADLVGPFLEKSLKALQLDYVDCYLIHSPVGVKYNGDDSELFPLVNGKVDIDPTTDLVAIWNALEKEVEAGRARSIGVSNFNIEQMQRVNKGAKAIKIANLQIELNAYFQQKEVQKFCKDNNIIITSYATFGSPGSKSFVPRTEDVKHLPLLLESPVALKIARAHKVSTSQVLLHHLARKGIVVIPKSTNPARIQVNFQIFNFKLTDEEIKELDGLDIGEGGRQFKMDFLPGFEEHPEHHFK
ncbi:unnamed protein product [Cyprideis torosa]|uniref:Uncharacterized protein n=1 Tax=Cyprideis torosa TaxID=163714 RepID=A0A7R8ZII6_9CRUS|nr:unnamed protein product [Cyprideis torosa]CAG0880031.1 unnamed protein product [Cyprideis torosa]